MLFFFGMVVSLQALTRKVVLTFVGGLFEYPLRKSPLHMLVTMEVCHPQVENVENTELHLENEKSRVFSYTGGKSSFVQFLCLENEVFPRSHHFV